MAQITMTQALNLAIDEAMADDPGVFCLGEDVSAKQGGGVFKVAGPRHCRNTTQGAVMNATDAITTYRRAIRARARAEFLDFEERAADLREAALRERREKERAARARHRKKARRSRVGDVSMSAVKLATNITSLIAAANAAVDGFQQVSGRTGGILRDFTDTADKLRSFFETAFQ